MAEEIEDTKKNKKKKRNYLKSILPFAIFLFVVANVAYFISFGFSGGGDDAARRGMWGTFGDFMGGTLNPLFALLSLYAIITTIKIQSKELKLSRKEIKATRKELKKSGISQEEQSKSFKIQNESIKLQTFENTFFKLLEHHNALNDKLNRNLLDHGIPMNLIIETRRDLLESFDLLNKGIVKTYFMSLYQFLKFIKEQEIKYQDTNTFESKNYTNIIRATFSDSTLILLAFNCSNVDFKKYKELIEHFRMFEHFDINPIRSISHARDKDGHMSEVSYDKLTPRLLDILRKYELTAFGNNSELIDLIKNPPSASLI